MGRQRAVFDALMVGLLVGPGLTPGNECYGRAAFIMTVDNPRPYNIGLRMRIVRVKT